MKHSSSNTYYNGPNARSKAGDGGGERGAKIFENPTIVFVKMQRYRWRRISDQMRLGNFRSWQKIYLYSVLNNSKKVSKLTHGYASESA